MKPRNLFTLALAALSALPAAARTDGHAVYRPGLTQARIPFPSDYGYKTAYDGVPILASNLLANADAEGTTLVLTIVNLRPDILDGLALLIASDWLTASVEELDASGHWMPVALQPPAAPRLLRLEGAFSPGISRIFRFNKRVSP